jgi:hypothetical protein
MGGRIVKNNGNNQSLKFIFDSLTPVESLSANNPDVNPFITYMTLAKTFHEDCC